MFLSIVIHTANILGIFTDPFEFEGDYGAEANPIRQKVFERVVSKEAISKNLSDSEVQKIMLENQVVGQTIPEHREKLIAEALRRDQAYGPLLSELITPELIYELTRKQKELQGVGFTPDDLDQMLSFLQCYGEQKAFYFFRNCPKELLSVDKKLRDKASREGRSFDLPILSSTQILTGRTATELKKELLNALFTEEKLKDTAPYKLFFYWAYQALNLQLVSENPEMIEQINRVKTIFLQTIGNPQARAARFKEKLIEAHSQLLFTQECAREVVQALTKDGLFLPVEGQNPQDGCFVFLRSEMWELDYEVISIEGYAGFREGRMNVILATQKETGTKFLLASCHGNSTQAEDGRLQIALVMEKFHQLVEKIPDLQLVIGIDANTKTEGEVELLRKQLDALGLVGTKVGPTTIKRRMVTTQHAKSGRIAVDEEDYLITLKPKALKRRVLGIYPEGGGLFLLTHPTVGFKEEKADISKPLPNQENPSDHYPVGVTLAR